MSELSNSLGTPENLPGQQRLDLHCARSPEAKLSNG